MLQHAKKVAKNLDNAQALDKAMETLQQVVAHKNNILNDSKYLNEDSNINNNTIELLLTPNNYLIRQQIQH